MARRHVQDPLPFMAAHERAELLDQANRRIQYAREEGALWQEQVTALRAELAQARIDCAKAQLQASLAALQYAQVKRELAEHRDTHAATPAHTVAALRRQVTQLIAVAHPDKWENHPCADEITKALVDFRDRLKQE